MSMIALIIDYFSDVWFAANMNFLKHFLSVLEYWLRWFSLHQLYDEYGFVSVYSAVINRPAVNLPETQSKANTEKAL